MQSILITGCSSGYGLETARHFLGRGWNVIATMRTPREGLLPRSERLRVLALDVTDARSIASVVATAGHIDVLVNNAGIGALGAFEATPMHTTRELFETNTFGTMAMTQAWLPQFRQRMAGTIVNITSSATLAPFPLVAAYTASKTAVQGFSASLAGELAPFNIRVRLVEPGYGPDTRFTENGGARMQGLITEPYAAYAHSVFAAFGQVTEVTRPVEVAEAVWRAATDASEQLHYPAGPDAVALALRRGGGSSASSSAGRPSFQTSRK